MYHTVLASSEERVHRRKQPQFKFFVFSHICVCFTLFVSSLAGVVCSSADVVCSSPDVVCSTADACIHACTDCATIPSANLTTECVSSSVRSYTACKPVVGDQPHNKIGTAASLHVSPQAQAIYCVGHQLRTFKWTLLTLSNCKVTM